MLPLNIDCGEILGKDWDEHQDFIIEKASLINVACGYHAGDALSMLRCIHQAKMCGTKIGAHPSYYDREGFGRRAMSMHKEELMAIMLHQIGSLYCMCFSQGIKMHHVKAHGALYNTACHSTFEAEVIADAMLAIDPSLILLAPYQSVMTSVAESKNIKVMYEAFADRKYMPDLSLQSRQIKGSFFCDISSIQQQINQINESSVVAVDGKSYPLHAHTICIHGDHENIREILNHINGTQ